MGMELAENDYVWDGILLLPLVSSQNQRGIRYSAKDS
jgi:hypothetical protein